MTTYRIALGILIAGALFCAAVLLGLAINKARADEVPGLKAEFFERAKRATIADGRTVNCCGEGDAVRVRLLGQDEARGLIIAEITDTMRSVNGRVGDVLTIPKGKITIGLYSPFADPIAFISGDLTPYCLSGPARG